jgi:glucosamine 6-phosphate synthetase-like amidotransferase/phosphosugar isomerase protein
MPVYPRAAILHTRYATQGSPSNNDNNHPILIPDTVIGIHNGIILNDDDLFAEHGWQRIAEVDSEAIFHLIGNATKPLQVLHDLQGRAAIAWFSVNDPHTLNLARLRGSPLFIAHTHRGSTVFASTDSILGDALDDCKVKAKVTYEVPEWTYMRIVRGRVVFRKDLTTQDPLTASARVADTPKR